MQDIIAGLFFQWFLLTSSILNLLSAFQESYVTREDNLRLAGEVISVLGALVILLLEVI